MEINITLFGQLITFALFVAFTMKYVWPPILKAMRDREALIAQGLAAGERGTRDLALAQEIVAKELQQARIQAADIIEQANKRALQLLEQVKQEAQLEEKRLMHIAKGHIEQEWQAAQQRLHNEIGELVIATAQKVINGMVDKKTHHLLIEQAIAEL